MPAGIVADRFVPRDDGKLKKCAEVGTADLSTFIIRYLNGPNDLSGPKLNPPLGNFPGGSSSQEEGKINQVVTSYLNIASPVLILLIRAISGVQSPPAVYPVEPAD